MGGQLRISWQKKLTADCAKDVLLIAQDGALEQRAEVVPRRRTELTTEDKVKLEKLALPVDKWEEDASIMTARVALDDTLRLVGVERSLPWEPLTKKHVIRRMERLLKCTKKSGGKLGYSV